ncbi:histidine--tRNA ligase [Patescibacteria group bacterium]|nr:histidine--tRNA ligase [Patescibacteria group bacterium]
MKKQENKINTKVLPGFVELLPADQILFDSMKSIIEKTYQSFGFISLDTPLIERSEVLLSKSGGETEKQIYRFSKGDNDLSLRFDLTVPLARYVSDHFNDLNFPFRRYHVGKVFRGERPQKGRYREFYQCDIDIVGKDKLSLVNDAEILAVIYQVFKNLELPPFIIKINNRKLINGLIESLGLLDKSVEIMRVIDKIEKVSKKDFKIMLSDLSLSAKSISTILKFLSIKGDTSYILSELDALKIQNETFSAGLEELKTVLKYVKSFNLPQEYYGVDLSIARGLDYYTGTVYETSLLNYDSIGSICSGGRYDDLVGSYISQKLLGVGISIGLTRLFAQLQALKIIKTSKATPSKVIILPFAEEMFGKAIEINRLLRGADIASEVYFEDDKFKNKISYVNKLGSEFSIIIGQDELKDNFITLKNMQNGNQEKVDINDLIKKIT